MKFTISNLHIPVLQHIYKLLTFFVFSVTFFITSPNVAIAGANLMVTPSRVVFEERTRTAQVTLLNTGNEAGSFRISFIRQQMTESGEFIKVEANEKGKYSDQMIRYSPRQVTLPAGQSQVIRLMLRKPRDLEAGEYRSHMLFQMIPKASKSSLDSAMNKNDDGITIEIIPIVGVSIPIIARHGKLESHLKLENARINPANQTNPKPSISVNMLRNGNQSIYGDFRAIFTANDGSAPIVIALVNGVAVYTPNNLRQFSIPLSVPLETPLKEGKVRILFLESGKDETTGLIAETNFAL